MCDVGLEVKPAQEMEMLHISGNIGLQKKDINVSYH